jgi:hypothetical protein
MPFSQVVDGEYQGIFKDTLEAFAKEHDIKHYLGIGFDA